MRPPVPAHPPRFHALALASLVAVGVSAALPARATPADLTDLPLESLLDTEVVSATRFAGQVTDAASAVSVLTAEEIRIYGLRTLGEVLDHMRGIHISHSSDYVYLGARGTGGDTFASRVLMLVDGNPPPDNLYDQLYLGRDGLIDVAMIDRIEYAPGNGSAMYGNNALLGVINVITKRGRTLDGVEVSGALGDWNQRTWRVSAGRRQANGLEWLASLSVHHDNGLASPEIGDFVDHYIGHSQTVLLKAQYEGFHAQLMTAQRRVARDYRFLPIEVPGWYDAWIDRNELLALGHDSRPAPHWRVSLRAQHGRYAYRFNDAWADGYRYEDVNDGRWWALDAQAGYDGWQHQRVALGVRLRHDPQQRFHYWDSDGSRDTRSDSQRAVGFSVEDEFTLSEAWSATVGIRADHRIGSPWTWSPRVATVWQVSRAWSLKASHGRSALYRSAAEAATPGNSQAAAGVPVDEAVTATTSELVSEYKQGGLRVLGSLYHFSTRNEDAAGTTVNASARGAELEVEWQSAGWRVRGSQAWQDAAPGAGQGLYYSPRHLTKLQASAPLHGEALRLSATARHVGAYASPWRRIPARTLLDLTLVSQKAVANLDLRVGWRNLLQKGDPDASDHWLREDSTFPTRSAWIELTGTFR
ncbi:TonB-dependent receptor plug domain-containing protein [Ideonella sp.]|uniref:TonB-dependent receptor plug domain-containing protein n=1 Tax=Ideonella sp. TaxID=1929293 RepID=UPI0035B2E4B0